MKAVFSLHFRSPALAKKAFEVLGKELQSEKGNVKAELNAAEITATVESESFTGLRAISNSFLRCAKIAYDVMGQVEKEKEV